MDDLQKILILRLQVTGPGSTERRVSPYRLNYPKSAIIFKQVSLLAG
jgi:hypothetical protein